MASLKTLVLIPGLLCDRIVWQYFIAQIGGKMPIVVADLSSQDSISQMAEDALKSCSGPLCVAGHSMGVRVALEMVRMAPDRIEKLALLDGGVYPCQPGEDIIRNKLVDLAFIEGMRALADQWLPPLVHPDRHNDMQLMNMLTAMVERKTPEIHQNQIKAILNRPDARLYLSSITCDTLLIIGRQDVATSVPDNEDICRDLTNGNVVVIENSGHFTLVEQPHIVSVELDKWAFE